MIDNSILIALYLVSAILVLINMSHVKLISTYKTTIIKKRKMNAMDGIFIPKTDYLLLTEHNQKVETTSRIYPKVTPGDVVVINVYSNGVHRLDHYPLVTA